MNLLQELSILLEEMLYSAAYGDVSHELIILACILKHAITRFGSDFVLISKAELYGPPGPFKMRNISW